MAAILLVRLLNNGSAQWARVNAEDSSLSEIETGSMDTLSLEIKNQDTRDQQVIVLVPSDRITFYAVDLPKINRKQQFKAIPFALEDQLPADIEDYFFLPIDQKTENGRTAVMVVKHEYMREWFKLLNDACITPSCMMPDLFAIAYTPNTWQVYIENNLAMIRTEMTQGFTTEVAHLDQLVQQNQLHKTVVTNNQQTPSLLEQIIKTDLKKPIVNLLQGEYYVKPVREVGDAWYYSWLVSWCLVIVLMVVVVLGRGITALYLSRLLSAQQHQMNHIFYQTFPATTPLENSAEQMKHQLQKVKQSAQGGKFLGMLDKIGRVMKQYPMLSFDSLDFAGNNITITLDVVNLQWQQEVMNKLAAQGFTLNNHYENHLLTLIIQDNS